jgi:hypothetical protein
MTTSNAFACVVATAKTDVGFGSAWSAASRAATSVSRRAESPVRRHRVPRSSFTLYPVTTTISSPDRAAGRGLHPARKYQPSTGAVKGSKILWPRRFRTRTPSRALSLCTAKAS